jgi:regulatory protein
MQIVNIRKTSPESVYLVFNDGTSIKTTKNLIVDMHIYNGMELDEEQLSALKEASSLECCKQHALRLLNQRMMSCKELKDKLIHKGETKENSEKAMAWLQELGFLDDVSYAEIVVKHYNRKGFGPARIRNELYRHGVPKELWDDALENISDPINNLIEYLNSKNVNLDDKTEKRKLIQALYRRGYSWSDISIAFNRLQENWEDE